VRKMAYFRCDYDRTLMAWHESGETLDEIMQITPGDFTDWKYYLLSCAGVIPREQNQLWQIVLSKKG